MKPIPQNKSVSTMSQKTKTQQLMSEKVESQKTTISPRFEELAILLPEHITQPTIKQLAIKVQQVMFEEIELDSESLEPSSVQQGDITKANTILNHMVNCPNADASVLVVVTNEPKPKLLLTRRASHLNSHAGEVSFAGGKHDLEDGNNLVTALREACEETALPPSQVQIIGQLPTQVSKKGLVVRPIVAVVNNSVTYVPELGEIERIFWADLETLIDQPIIDYILPYRMGGQSIHIRTPSWHVDGEVVWGLTGRILASLLEVGFDRKVDWYYEPTKSLDDAKDENQDE